MRYAKYTLTGAAVAALVFALGMSPALAADGTPSTKQQSLSREEAASQSSRAAKMRGALPSLYRGDFFNADQEDYRHCVAEREGTHTYMLRGGGGDNYYGTYQFHKDFQWGVPYMMAKESAKNRDGLWKEAMALRYKPINRWNRYWQDRAFYTVLNWDAKWSGKKHWAGGRWHC